MYLLHAVHFAKRGLMNSKTARGCSGESQMIIWNWKDDLGDRLDLDRN